MATFTWIPDIEPEGEYTPDVTAVKFGDGYEQRQPRGINNLRDKWSLSFSQREQAEADAIHAFLKARGASESFDWTPPGESAASKYVCRSWRRRRHKGTLWTVTGTFEQVIEYP